MTGPRHSSGITFADGDDYSTNGAGQIVLPPSRDNLEWAERLLTFWNVYVLEGSWGAVEGFPNARWNGHELRARITAPWPKDLEMYGVRVLQHVHAVYIIMHKVHQWRPSPPIHHGCIANVCTLFYRNTRRC